MEPPVQPLEWTGQRVLVFGLGQSGRAASELLVRHGAQVVGVDEGAQAAETLESAWGRRSLWRGSTQADVLFLDGVGLFVLSPGIPTTHPFVRAARDRKIPVVSEVELAFRCSRGSILAITGTKGKSTTAALAGALLVAQGKTVHVAGNIGIPYSAVADQIADHDWVVLELSSFQLETVDSLHAQVAVLLRMSPDHMDRYPDMDTYVAAKARITRHQTAEDVLVLDPRDPHANRVGRASRSNVVGFGFTWDGSGVVRQGEDLVWSSGDTSEKLATTSDVPLLGEHNLDNTMAALAAVRSLGPFGTEVRQALRDFQALPYRMQPVGRPEGIQFINDSKSTSVESVRAGLQGLPGPLLLGLGGRNKGLDFRGLQTHMDRVRVVLVFGEAAPEITEALGDSVRIVAVRDLDEMVAQALRLGCSGDTFLFSPGCTSFDMFQNAEHRGREFEAAVRRRVTDSEKAAGS